MSREWKKLKIGDICDVTSSKRIYAKEYKETGMPFYRSKEIIEKFNGNSISTKLFITEEKFDEIKNKFGVPIKGDILLSSVGTLGVPYFVQNEKFYFKDGNLTWFKNFKNSYSEFIFLWLQSPHTKNQINSKSIGSTQKALTIDVLKNFEINLPPLPVQKKIAAILSSLDDKIDNNRKTCEKLEKIAQSIFKQWFVDFEFPDEDGKQYKSSGGEMEYCEELGKDVPEGWKCVSLYDAVKLFDSQRIPLSKIERSERIGNIPYYGATGIMDYIDIPIFSGEYILMAEDGSVINDLGYPIIQYAWGEFWVNNHAHIMQGKIVSNGFLYFLLKQLKVGAVITGAVQKKISQRSMQQLKFVVPHNNYFFEFDNMLKIIKHKQIENKKLQQVRDVLLPKLMSGELLINNTQERN